MTSSSLGLCFLLQKQQLVLLIWFSLNTSAWSFSNCPYFRTSFSRQHIHVDASHRPRIDKQVSISPVTLFSLSIDSEISIQDSLNVNVTDSNGRVRPYDQRVDAPRPARRLNHVFKHLYRHDIPKSIQSMDPMTYLQEYAGYTKDQVLVMNQSFPPLLTLSVPRQLHPKLRFLRETLHCERSITDSTSTITKTSLHSNTTLSILPPQYFGARLERVLAPRHAFLVYANLTHGYELVSDPSKWNDFLRAVRKPKMFAALCQSWHRATGPDMLRRKESTTITVKQIEAFDALFGRGLMAAARNELVQPNNTWPLQYINMTASTMIALLIQHGANPWQYDHRGVSLLHWAAGTGHLDAIPILLEHGNQPTTKQSHVPKRSSLHVFDTRTLRDGATALHWAAAGAKARAFGCGGHVHVCRFLLDQVPTRQRKEYVNTLTKDGNSALMWAAWSGTLETVKLLVRHRASTDHVNRNGCSVAHWAASGGDLAVCQYLYDTVGVDFSMPNHGDNTPVRDHLPNFCHTTM